MYKLNIRATELIKMTVFNHWLHDFSITENRVSSQYRNDVKAHKLLWLNNRFWHKKVIFMHFSE